ncbi:DUF3870 domain-containing protein [Bacillus benzoevorans]|uniref:DUF3870 domain-containing protein n=1 Tax=Bacillus benzoevorans TaxID=1456 RepID=A0A7X0LVA0_9BACI|nr:DUF3870 domain-containing protein [Bacillus benzoevorans]MBB6445315.1 hypothetical protein [Bacillus benzoevorans]
MNTYLIAGYAKLPQGMAAKNIDESMTITLELEFKYGVIIDAVCTLETESERDYIQRLLRGYCLRDGIAGLIERVQTHYRGKEGHAVEAALMDAYSQFETVPMRR